MEKMSHNPHNPTGTVPTRDDRDKEPYSHLDSFMKNVNEGSKSTSETKVLSVSSINCPSTLLGESPTWCGLSKCLIFIDVSGKMVFKYSPREKRTDSMHFDQLVGFAVSTSASTEDHLILFVGLEDKIVEVDFTMKHIIRVVLFTPRDATKPGRFNDAKCAPDGTLYAGYMNMNWRNGYHGHLFKIANIRQQDGSYSHKLYALGRPGWPDVHLPNGSAWIGDTLYLVDSATASITSYTIDQDQKPAAVKRSDIETLNITRKFTVFTLSHEDVSAGHMLDGMTVDNDGHLWVAVSGGGCILRIDPDLGKEVHRIYLPAKKPTSCTFGGPRLDFLFVTCRNKDESKYPSGRTFVCHIPGIRGQSAMVPVRTTDPPSTPPAPSRGARKFDIEDPEAFIRAVSVEGKPVFDEWEGPPKTQKVPEGDAWWIEKELEDEQLNNPTTVVQEESMFTKIINFLTVWQLK